MSGVGEPSWSLHEHTSCLGWGSNSVQVVNVPGGVGLERENSDRPEGVSASGSATGEHGCCSPAPPLPFPSVAGGHEGVGTGVSGES